MRSISYISKQLFILILLAASKPIFASEYLNPFQYVALTKEQSKDLVKAVRKKEEKRYGTAYDMAKKCVDFDINKSNMATMYCYPIFNDAIASAEFTTGCHPNKFNAMYLIKKRIESIWFFNKTSFFSVVEQVLKNNYQCDN
jgi:hypothetical protein